MCSSLQRKKSRLRQKLREDKQIFWSVDMPEKWANTQIIVKSRESWEIFIKALRDLFVEDMKSPLNKWKDKLLYPKLHEELHSIRLRRNFVEHPESKEGKKEETKCCQRDIGKEYPTSQNDWLKLQIVLLHRLTLALDEAIEHC